MLNFNLHTTTEIVFGKDIEEQIGPRLKEFGAHRILVHFGGSSARTSGLLDRVEKSLFAAGLAFVELGGVSPNPKVSLVRKGIALAEREGIDFVLAVGGGSVIDSAKAIAMGVATKTDPWQFASTGTKPDTTLPVGTVLTLAASGSESSNSCVLTNEETKEKRGITSETNRPRISFLDPENTYTVSKFQTGCGIVDIMMHTMERYFTTEQHVELSDELAEGLMRTVKTFVPEALANPKSYPARANLLLAGAKSHDGLTGLGRVGDFACHAIEHEIGAMFDVAHGAGLTAIWSSWAKYVIDVDPERFAQFAVNVWGVQNNFHDAKETGLRGIDAWDEWCHSINLPTSLHELGIDPTDEQIHEMAQGAVDARGGDHAGAFMELHVEDIENILKNAR